MGSFNIKGVPVKGWIMLGIAVGIMAAALIFKPEFSKTQGDIILGVVAIVLLYILLNVTGVLGKLFNKK